MFARKIRVEYEDKGERLPCPLKWLDSFSMRNFTNASVFDDTLPVAGGEEVINNDHALAFLDSVFVYLKNIRAVFQFVFNSCGWGGQLARLPHRDKSGVQTIGEGRTEDESASFHSKDQIDFLRQIVF